MHVCSKTTVPPLNPVDGDDFQKSDPCMLCSYVETCVSYSAASNISEANEKRYGKNANLTSLALTIEIIIGMCDSQNCSEKIITEVLRILVKAFSIIADRSAAWARSTSSVHEILV